MVLLENPRELQVARVQSVRTQFASRHRWILARRRLRLRLGRGPPALLDVHRRQCGSVVVLGLGFSVHPGDQIKYRLL